MIRSAYPHINGLAAVSLLKEVYRKESKAEDLFVCNMSAGRAISIHNTAGRSGVLEDLETYPSSHSNIGVNTIP